MHIHFVSLIFFSSSPKVSLGKGYTYIILSYICNSFLIDDE